MPCDCFTALKQFGRASAFEPQIKKAALESAAFE
jgi:hypothetical protein